MKLLTISLLTASLAGSAMAADMFDKANKAVDNSAQSATTKTDSASGNAQGAVTNTLGAGAVTDATNAQVNQTSEKGKAKTNAAATRAKSKIRKVQAGKEKAMGTANQAVDQAGAAVGTAENKAADAVAPVVPAAPATTVTH